MSKLSKWWRDLWEAVRARYYDGPNPPARLGQIAQAFAITHPHATRAEWIAFATAHAGESYRSGYTRGLEWRERTRTGEPNPEEDAQGHDWTWLNEDLAPPDLGEMVVDGDTGGAAVDERIFIQELLKYEQERAGVGPEPPRQARPARDRSRGG